MLAAVKRVIVVFLAVAVLVSVWTPLRRVDSAPQDLPANSVSPDGWGLQNPWPGRYRGLAVWGSSPSDVWAVGDKNKVFHYDGSAWSERAIDTSATMGRTMDAEAQFIRSIWGASSSDVFAVGGTGTILHCDNGTWALMRSGTTANLYDIWGSSASDIFAVGAYGTILHYDGTDWTAMSFNTTQELRAVWGSSPSDVWAAGTGTFYLHYDGKGWKARTSPTYFQVSDIWGSSASDVFVVGSSGHVQRFNGENWTDVSSDTYDNLWGVWGASSSDVFVTTDYGIRHFNGSEWSDMISDASTALYGLWGSSTSDVFAVGYSFGGGGGDILHYDGSTWRAFTNYVTRRSLYSVSGTSPTDVYAAGDWYDNEAGRQEGTVLHYDGSVWTTISSGTPAFLGVYAVSAADVYAWSSKDVFRLDGGKWTPMNCGASYALTAVWGSSPTDLYAVGDLGTVRHYDGNEWKAVDLGMYGAYPPNMVDVFGNSSTDVYAMSEGDVFHYDGNAWSAISGRPGYYDATYNTYHDYEYHCICRVHGNPSGIYILTDDQISVCVLQYDGITWSVMNAGIGCGYRQDAWGSSPSDMFVVTGDVGHFDGSGWSRMDPGAGNYLHAVWGSCGQDVFAVGTDGTILHYPELADVAPSVASVEPVQGQRETTADVTITGGYFIGASAVDFGSGITVDKFTVATGTRIVAHISIDGSARLGPREVAVTGPAGTGRLKTGFGVISLPPRQPMNVQPAKGEGGVNLTPTLESSAFSDSDSGESHVASQWQVTAVAGDYSKPVFDTGGDEFNLTRITLPGEVLRYGTTYFWRVRYQDNNSAWSDWSSETSFTTAASQGEGERGGWDSFWGGIGVGVVGTLAAGGLGYLAVRMVRRRQAPGQY